MASRRLASEHKLGESEHCLKFYDIFYFPKKNKERENNVFKLISKHGKDAVLPVLKEETAPSTRPRTGDFDLSKNYVCVELHSPLVCFK